MNTVAPPIRRHFRRCSSVRFHQTRKPYERRRANSVPSAKVTINLLAGDHNVNGRRIKLDSRHRGFSA